ncbi:MAG TPA: radical SAM protein [Candidatus Nanoarchaeia archaeon]|nr:radical SAM protein [Candidatus Nanoarchaeia archaeon]
MLTILDCYTDEPAGLGVPPYLGTYPRYLYGQLADESPTYITIDDLRFFVFYDGNEKKKEISHKTNIKIYNLTKNVERIGEIVKNTSKLIINIGVHVPGKYLSAIPGTLHEVKELVQCFDCAKVLTGPGIFGTQLEGGKASENVSTSGFSIKSAQFPFKDIKDYAVRGVGIMDQIPEYRIIEIETSRGCGSLSGCSFCTEPIKNRLEFRPKDDILQEIKVFYDKGCRYFRLGKQSCIIAFPKLGDLLKEITDACPDMKVLHVDNVDPKNVVTKRGTQAVQDIVKYCTSGNIAAMGVETFDPAVSEANTLNAPPEMAMEAIRIVNKYGAERGPNGMPKFLPGINLIYGLNEETKHTNEYNMKAFQTMLDENLLIRRINIRQVALFEGTALSKTVGLKFLHKNKRYYWKWRNEVRQKVDLPMLRKLVPTGAILRNVYAEIYDGNTTFARQIGTYPLIVGIKGRLPLKQFFDIKVTDHMLRSITGIVV